MLIVGKDYSNEIGFTVSVFITQFFKIFDQFKNLHFFFVLLQFFNFSSKVFLLCNKIKQFRHFKSLSLKSPL